jgi:3-phosphoshikimate 1-carboxyvinyltransferase
MGKTTIHGLLEAQDCLATLQALRQLGVVIDKQASNSYCVHGVGLHGFTPSHSPIDCGNSGTSMRLLAGVLASCSFVSHLIGDNSLQNRPMGRIVHPLRKMWATLHGQERNGKICAPLHIIGNPHLEAMEYTLPVPSAQVKSCLLLAGLSAKNKTILIENGASRDHTERMMQAFGVHIDVNDNKITLFPTQPEAQEVIIPGDISSAAFFIAGAAMTPDSHVIVRSVGVNARRIGIIHILRRMGAQIELLNQREICNEPVADIEVKGTKLKGITVPSEWIVSAIDEFPVIFVAAMSALGDTTIRGLEELRLKETDRIHVMSQGLKALGGNIEEFDDGVRIQGSSLKGGAVASGGDHRVAMAFAMASLIAQDSIIIRDCDNIATSFPNFCTLAQHLGLTIHQYAEG